MVVGFSVLQYGKLRLLKVPYNFSTKFRDADKFEELGMGRDSLYLALAEKELEDCIRPQMEAEWERLSSKYCTDSFTSESVSNLFPRRCCNKHEKHNREPGLFKE